MSTDGGEQVERVDLLAALQASIDRHKATGSAPQFAQGGVIRPSEGEDSGPPVLTPAQRRSEAHAAVIQCVAEIDRGLTILDAELRRGQFNAARVTVGTLKGIVGLLDDLASQLGGAA